MYWSYYRKSKTNQWAHVLVDLIYEEFRDSVLALFDPKIKHHVIDRVEDIALDGHCDYRCCVELLGLNPVDGWLNPLILGPPDDIQIVQMLLYNDCHSMKLFWKKKVLQFHIFFPNGNITVIQKHLYGMIWFSTCWWVEWFCWLSPYGAPLIQSCLSELKPYYFYPYIFI